MSWKATTIGDFAPFSYGKGLAKKERRQGGINVFGSNGTVGSHTQSLVDEPGVIVGRKGSVGEVHFSAAPFWPIDTTLFVVGSAERDIRFTYYLLKHLTLQRLSGDSAVPGLNRDAAHSEEVVVPDLATQRRIAAVLGSLDDLIENNRRRIELLEEMAQVIYREWFVHFRYPGHEDATFVDSPLGPIPEGWEVRSLSDLCSRIQAGGTPKRSEPAFWSDGTVDWYKTGDLTDSILIRSSEQITEHAVASSSTRTFEPETILMAIYGAPTVGRLGLVETTSSANQAALGLIADPSVSSTAHLWFALRELREPLNRIAQGAAQQNVSKQKVADAQVISAPSEVINQFTVSAGVPWRLGHRLAHANAGLAGLRDLLLPKLVTGEIDVSDLDLDALVEAAS